jgi:type I restriction enzyme M protein
MERGKRIEECTRLFDENDVNNPEKASSYIYRAFNGDISAPIAESMTNNVFRLSLVDMLAFDRNTFEKNISLAIKKKEQIKSKWEMARLDKIITLEYGKALKENQRIKGNFPVVGSNGIVGYHNKFLIAGPAIIIGRKGSVGKVTYINENCYPIDTTFYVNPITNDNFKYLYYVLLSLHLENTAGGTGVPGVNRNELYEKKIPLPPKDIQDKIVAEIEEIEADENKANNEISALNAKIEQSFADIYKKANTDLKLSDTDIFSVSIGKRVLESEVTENGKIPVYSANVCEPFGYIEKELITDFNVPSVLWGIDGDWMVNYIDANKPFYPTDHCGVLRVKNNEVHPRYLAWVLKAEGLKQGFSRNLRASIDRIKGLSIIAPPVVEQQKAVAEIEKLEKRIQSLKKEQEQFSALKENILKKYGVIQN